jgi:hypothetical protein
VQKFKFISGNTLFSSTVPGTIGGLPTRRRGLLKRKRVNLIF